MGIHHCAPGEVLNLLRLNGDLPHDSTFAVVKTEQLDVIRMFLPEGKRIAEHHVQGEITVQCISGRVEFTVAGEPRELTAHDWIFLAAEQPHALHATEESVLLVTISLK